MNGEENALQKHQMAALEILLEFRRVCEQLGLRYYLTAGTLLGAVRHGGFIPWDDDVDVVMPREDYDKFRHLAPQILQDGFLYQSSETEKNFPFYFAKLRKQGTYAEEPLSRSIDMEQGLFIDIFPLDKCPDGDMCATIFFKGMSLLYSAVMGRVCKEFVCGSKKKCVHFLLRILKLLPNQWLFVLREMFRRGMGGYLFASGKRWCTVGGRHGYPRETYQKIWFERTAEVSFEKENFPAPSGWNELLKNMYGDYMRLPSPEERKTHFVY